MLFEVLPLSTLQTAEYTIIFSHYNSSTYTTLCTSRSHQGSMLMYNVMILFNLYSPIAL